MVLSGPHEDLEIHIQIAAFILLEELYTKLVPIILLNNNNNNITI